MLTESYIQKSVCVVSYVHVCVSLEYVREDTKWPNKYNNEGHRFKNFEVGIYDFVELERGLDELLARWRRHGGRVSSGQRVLWWVSVVWCRKWERHHVGYYMVEAFAIIGGAHDCLMRPIPQNGMHEALSPIPNLISLPYMMVCVYCNVVVHCCS